MLNLQTSKETLLLLKKVFDKNNITFRLGYGTLLGAVRDKNFISGDNDIDLVLLANEKVKVECILQVLVKKGFKVVKKCNCFITLERKGTLIDLYFFDQRNLVDKLLFRYTCSYGFWCIYIPKNYLFEGNNQVFGEVCFFGETFCTFYNYLEWLSRTYGDYSRPQNRKGNTRTLTSKVGMRFRLFARSRLKGVWFDLFYSFYLRVFK